MIRLAHIDDVDSMATIERAADAVFRDIGMAAIADGEPMPMDDLLTYQRAGRAWVDSDDSDRTVAYLLLDIVDDVPHIEQVSVHPACAGQGKGRNLIEMAATWSKQNGFSSLTLTTFTEVPWNAPYYARLGFEVIPVRSAGLRHIREHEAAIGLDAWPWVAMRRLLAG